ncbi:MULTISPECIES: galactokinase family protein [unclassified Arcicella]|uniref:GHMP family kinase ATP-binding protein n=1 Tax=unclassified Arcicella TaxID=2644986 RepID=UPI00285F43A3|nr:MULTISPECIES: galactokinase family protein [unclassified Arcicella]MDR6561818.1 galactokinase [Arcicella sp. BE51]MDR6813964.1 galactokinase [Arcicella sp. BE140]MDR6825329.1 galactokinase [Arcicella sp. BE139]
MSNKIKVSTPGRICLFGEHQDYLGLPVIAAAISKRVNITGENRNDGKAILHLPDIDSEISFDIYPELPYLHKRDYFRSALNILQRQGYSFKKGLECTVEGNIPINSGTSSSSALLANWIHFLSRIADEPNPLSANEIAEIAYHAEVVEFKEAGGMMDHYSTAVGNVIYLESTPKIYVETLKPKFGSFVLGDSLEPKDTVGILKRVKYGVLEAVEKIKKEYPDFSLFSVTQEDVKAFVKLLNNEELDLIKANIDNREILIEALALLKAETLNHEKFGELLNQHQLNLQALLKISTPKIDRMLAAAKASGALGGKINGSGGGGCMFVYAPENPEAVAKSIENEGGKAYIIQIDEGTSLEN